jgi:hypothetical protein
MVIGNRIIGVLLVAFLTTPVLAVPPETVKDYCADRSQAPSGSVTSSIQYRVGFIDGFLDAVIDSLRKDGYVCPSMDAQEFCNLYSHSDFLGGGAFDRARDALLQICRVVG